MAGRTRVLSEDMARILSIPRGLAGQFDLDTEALKKPGGTFDLWPAQKQALATMQAAGGALLPVGVGFGKTLIGELAAVVLGAKRPLLLIEPNLLQPLLEQREIFDPHFKLSKPGIMTYNDLSSFQGEARLHALKPDLIVADECHNLKYLKSARTSRLCSYFLKYPETKFVGMSGTITSRSLADYAHLLELALRGGSPLPLDPRELDLWCRCLDAWSPQLQPATPVDWVSIAPLIQEFYYGTNTGHRTDPLGNVVAGKHSSHDPIPGSVATWADEAKDTQKREMARGSFKNRFITTPGIFATSSSSYEGSLLLYKRGLEIPDEVRALVVKIKDGQFEDNGVRLSSPFDKARLLKEVAQGFYYRWVWENNTPNLHWYGLRSRWNKEMAQIVEQRLPGLDTPGLIERALLAQLAGAEADYKFSQEQIECYSNWTDEDESSGPIGTETVWFSDFFLKDIQKRATKHPSLLWFEHQAIGEALQKAGWLVNLVPKDQGKQSVALSISKFGTGYNLQGWSRSVVVHPPSGGLVWEQLIGREARSGQEADSVETVVYQHTPEFINALKQAENDSEYLERSQGLKTKLKMATKLIDPEP